MAQRSTHLSEERGSWYVRAGDTTPHIYPPPPTLPTIVAMHPIALVALILLLGATHVHALEVLSDVTSINIVNGVPTSKRTMNIKCARADWGHNQAIQITSPTGQVQEASVYCSAFRDSYTGSIVGYVPDEGRLYEHQVCTASPNGDDRNKTRLDPFAFLALNSTELQGMRSNHANRMQLLSQIHESNRWLRHSPNIKSPFHAQVVLREMAFFNGWSAFQEEITPRPTLGSVTKGVAIAVVSALLKGGPAGLLLGVMTALNFGGGTPGLNELREQVDILEQRLGDVDRAVALVDQRSIEYEQTLREFADTFTEYRSSTATAFESLYEQTTLAQDTAETVGAAVQLLREEFVRSRDSQLAITETLHSQTALIRDRTNDLSGNIVDLSGLVAQLSGATEASLRQVIEQIQLVSSGTRDNFAQIVWSINNQTAAIDDRIRTVTRVLSNTQSALYDAINKRDTMREISYIVHDRMNAIAFNSTLTPMLTSYGSPPDPGALIGVDGTANQPIDVIDMFSIAFGSGGYGAFQDTVTMVCDLYYLLQLRTMISSWRDVTDAIGPAACANAETVSNGTAVCRCHVIIKTATCTTASLGESSTFLASNQLIGSMCIGGIVASPTVTTIWDSASFVTAIGTICNRGLHTGTRMRVASALRQSKYEAVHIPDVCALDFGKVQAGLVSGVTMPFLLMQYLQYGLANAVIRTDGYDRYIVGTLPGGLTFQEDPVDRYTGKAKMCMTASFMAYNFNPQNMLPVIAYQKTSAGAVASLTISGSTYSINTDAIQSRLLSIAPDTFVSVTAPYQPNVAYDIPQGLLPITANPYSRRGAVTYPMMPSATEGDAITWAQANAANFDAYSGSVTADTFRVNLSPVSDEDDNMQGERCLYMSGPQQTAQYETSVDNSVCRIKENARFHPVGSGVDTYLVSSVSQEFYTIQVEFPEGSVAGILFTDCPVGSVVAISSTANDLLLTNPTTQDITFDLHIDGRCTNRVNALTVRPSSTYRFTIRDCPHETNNTITVSAYTLGNSSHICSGFPMDATVNRTVFVSTYGNVDPVYVDKVQRVIEDRLAQVHLQGQFAIADALATMTNYVIDISLLNNLSIPLLDLSAFRNISDAARALAAQVIRERDNFTRAYDQLESVYDQQIDDFNKQIVEYNSTWDAVIAQYNSLITAAAAAEIRSRESLNDLASVNQKLGEVQGRLTIAEANFLAAIRNFTHAQAEFDRQTVRSFRSLLSTDGFDLLGLILDIVIFILVMCTIWAAIKSLIAWCGTRRQGAQEIHLDTHNQLDPSERRALVRPGETSSSAWSTRPSARPSEVYMGDV